VSHREGEKHHLSKLTDAQVREIRSVYERWKAMGSKKGYRALEDAFGASRWTLRDIVTYRTRRSA
jgi:hypothetical protein